jgi:predicted permease
VGTLWQDVKFGVRMLRKSRGFTIVAILTLALGIGANGAIFTIVNAFLFRPLPVPNADRLAVVAVQSGAQSIPAELSYRDYVDYRQQTDAFTDLAAYAINVTGLGTKGHADRIIASYVTSNYFSTLGVQPAVGRFFAAGEGDQPNSSQVVVLGHHYWEQRFGGNPDVVGSAVNIDGRPVTIIGIVPKEFRGTFSIAEMDAYVPIGMIARGAENLALFTDRKLRQLRVIGALKPGLSVQAAQASLTVIAQRLANEYPQTDQGQSIYVYPEQRARPSPSAGRTLPLAATAFLALVGLILVLSCLNVANLVLARGAARQKEMAIRAAMGARRPHLIRQVLTETILLALGGGVAGALLGSWLCHSLESLRVLGDFPVRFGLTLDWRVFSYVTAIALVSGVIAGLVPALRASRTDINETLGKGGRGLTNDSGHFARNALVVAQVSGSLVLLIAAGLFVRSLNNAETIDLGFDAHNILNVGIDPALQGYDQPRSEAFFRELLRRAKLLPGVQSASLAFTVPMNYSSLASGIYIEGQESAPANNLPEAGYNVVSPEYFATIRTPLLSGRAFTAADTSTTEPVAIVNQTFAERFWPHQNPIGRRFSYTSTTGPFVSVIGVARNGKYGEILESASIYFYVPQTQNYQSGRVLQLRTAVSPQSLIPAIEAQVRELDPNLPVFDVMTMEQELAGLNGFFLFHMGAVFAGAMGILGMLLAVLGLYGVVSFNATRRTQEIGVRMALGALPRDILALVLRQVLILVATGVCVGIVSAIAISRVLSGLLLGVSSRDPMTFAGISVLLAAVALVACYLPARRAARLDPSTALRCE